MRPDFCAVDHIGGIHCPSALHPDPHTSTSTFNAGSPPAQPYPSPICVDMVKIPLASQASYVPVSPAAQFRLNTLSLHVRSSHCTKTLRSIISAHSRQPGRSSMVYRPSMMIILCEGSMGRGEGRGSLREWEKVGKGILAEGQSGLWVVRIGAVRRERKEVYDGRSNVNAAPYGSVCTDIRESALASSDTLARVCRLLSKKRWQRG